ncbi:MAG: heat shock protein DnaJ domain protein [Deltaproteobacteria bacterium]|nr:heat shock protein DnaJ domain protein [Deltaproteobacteria bacterium]
MPAEIAGIGSTQQRLRVSPGFDPLKAAVGPEEYFVLSRIDGKQSLKDVLLTTGLAVDRTIAIITRLRSLGALLLPHESAAPAPAAVPVRPPAQPAKAPQPAAPNALRAAAGTAPLGTAEIAVPSHDLSLPNPTREELAALAEDIDLDDTDRRLILAIERLLGAADPRALLGVSARADSRDLKRAYFRLSKEIHPDRYYGKRLGTFAHRLPLVFEATSRAYARLTGTDRAKGSSPAATQRPEHGDQPQTPQAYASELFDRACQLEVGGDAMGAMKLFAAAVRVDSQLRYLRRAASCALAANQPRSAVEYAKKAHSLAPNDPSSARLLAASFRGLGRLNDAEEVLVLAMALKSENDTLTSELRNDLAEVRKLLAQ